MNLLVNNKCKQLKGMPTSPFLPTCLEELTICVVFFFCTFWDLEKENLAMALCYHFNMCDLLVAV